MLRELRLSFHSDDMDLRGNRHDLVYEGVVHYDNVSKAWVAEIDWDAIKHESDLREE